MATVEHLAALVSDYAATLADQADHLTELDRPIGDADHGTNMARGLAQAALIRPADGFPTPEAYLKKVGMTVVGTVGGACGPLYGTFFLRMAGPLAGVVDADAAQLGRALAAGVDGVLARGRAAVGDKTMYDVWVPALLAYDEALAAGQDLAAALRAVADAGEQARDATRDLVARRGRASYLGERSRGHVDPGAASSALLLQSMARTLT